MLDDVSELRFKSCFRYFDKLAGHPFESPQALVSWHSASDEYKDKKFSTSKDCSTWTDLVLFSFALEAERRLKHTKAYTEDDWKNWNVVNREISAWYESEMSRLKAEERMEFIRTVGGLFPQWSLRNPSKDSIERKGLISQENPLCDYRIVSEHLSVDLKDTKKRLKIDDVHL